MKLVNTELALTKELGQVIPGGHSWVGGVQGEMAGIVINDELEGLLLSECSQVLHQNTKDLCNPLTVVQLVPEYYCPKRIGPDEETER